MRAAMQKRTTVAAQREGGEEGRRRVNVISSHECNLQRKQQLAEIKLINGLLKCSLLINTNM